MVRTSTTHGTAALRFLRAVHRLGMRTTTNGKEVQRPSDAHNDEPLGCRSTAMVPPVVWTVSITLTGMLDSCAVSGEKVQVIPNMLWGSLVTCPFGPVAWVQSNLTIGVVPCGAVTDRFV